jgi:hypothetical protein
MSDRLRRSSIAIATDIYAVVEEQLRREVSERLKDCSEAGKIRLFAAFASPSHTKVATMNYFKMRK